MLIILNGHGLKQLPPLTDYIKINELTHILSSSSSSIDLTFTKHANLITDGGVHSSLHQNCYYLIIIAKVTMEILFPPYKCLVWDYTNSNIEAMNLAKETFN